jgi:imidazolonepropionase-like amidohydrolase
VSIDLSAATVLPGMIDAHVHLFPADDLPEATRVIVGVANAQTDLNAGFTTVLDMDSRGGFGTVDLRNAINRGLVLGPRMQVVGQSLNQRASVPYPALFNRHRPVHRGQEHQLRGWARGRARGQAARR